MINNSTWCINEYHLPFKSNSKIQLGDPKVKLNLIYIILFKSSAKLSQLYVNLLRKYNISICDAMFKSKNLNFKFKISEDAKYFVRFFVLKSIFIGCKI